MMTNKSHIRHNLTQEEKRSIAFEICEHVAHGELLSEISKEAGMPHPDTFRNWCHADPHIAIAWRDSQDDRIERVMRELLQIADEEIPTYKDARGNVRMDPSAAARMRVRVKTRHWLITLLLSHRTRSPHTSESAAPATSPPNTVPSPAPQHPLENPRVPAAPVLPPATARRNGAPKLPFPMSKRPLWTALSLRSSKNPLSMPKISPFSL